MRSHLDVLCGDAIKAKAALMLRILFTVDCGQRVNTVSKGVQHGDDGV